MKIMQGDIIMVPFPYSDLSSVKERPALVLSNHRLRGDDVIVAGITSHRNEHAIACSQQDLSKGQLPLMSYVKVGKIVSLSKGIIRSVEAKMGKEKMNEIFEALSKLIEVY